MAAEDEAKDGHQQQKQYEHRPKGRIGEVGHQGAAVVVAEFLHHSEKKSGGGVALLEPVKPAQRPLENVHRRPPRPAADVTSTSPLLRRTDHIFPPAPRNMLLPPSAGRSWCPQPGYGVVTSAIISTHA